MGRGGRGTDGDVRGLAAACAGALLLACCSDDDAVPSTADAGTDGGSGFVDGLFPGSEGSRLFDGHLPLVMPPMSGPDELAPRASFGGLLLSDRRIVMAFREEVTVGAANTALSSRGLRAVGGAPTGVVVASIDPPDFERLLSVAAELEADASVLAAAPDVALGLDSVPPPSDQADWTWDDPPAGKNFGLEIIRIPQAWNLVDWVRRRGWAPVEVGLLDGAFESHRDLPDMLILENPPSPAAGRGSVTHALNDACIVGAARDDGRGVEGVSPFARIVGVGQQHLGATRSDLEELDTLGNMLVAQGRLLLLEASDAPARVRIFNVSAGYKWLKFVNPYVPENAVWAEPLVASHGRVARQSIDWVNRERGPVLAFVSAGNDSGEAAVAPYGRDFDARLNSPWTWAALDPCGMAEEVPASVRCPTPNVIVVENVGGLDQGGDTAGDPIDTGVRRWTGVIGVSNQGGHVSAPGSAVWSCAADGGYDFRSGTSQAAPHAAGLAAYLVALDPTLSNAELRALVIGNPSGAGEMAPGLAALPSVTPTAPHVDQRVQAQPMIDAFGAALGIDVVRGNRTMQIALVDTDDGTPDGNTRVLRAPSGSVVDRALPEPTTAEGFPRRGDGVVDMRDFRRFRDALLQVEGGQMGLNGSPTSLRFDLNGDGVVEGHTRENRYPRFDFDGDGILHRTESVHFPGLGATRPLPMRRTDLDVMQDVLGGSHPDATRAADLEGWAAADLPVLVYSADLTVHFDGFFRDHDSVASVEIIFDSATAAFPRDAAGRVVDAGARRTVLRADPTPLVMTVPQMPGARVRLAPADADGNPVALEDLPVRHAVGDDDPVDTQTIRDALDLGDIVPGQDHWLRFGSTPMRLPDRIAFIQVHGSMPEASGIVTVLPDGSEETLLTGFTETRMASALACDHQGRFLVFLDSTDFDNVARISADGTEVERLTDSAASTGHRSPALSPDDTRVALLRSETSIVVLDIATGRLDTVVSGTEAFSSLSWSPDGETLYPSNGSQVFRVPATGGTPEPLTPAMISISVMGFPLDLPVSAYDGDAAPVTGRIAFVTNYGSIRTIPPPMGVSLTELYFIDPALPEMFVPITDASGVGFNKLQPRWSPDESQVAFGGNEMGALTQSIYVADVGTGTIRRLAPADGAQAFSPCWLRATPP